MPKPKDAACVLEEMIDALEERFIRTPVDGHAVLQGIVMFGLQVSVNVSSSKAINGLFRVTDQEERLMFEEGAKQVILFVVGVLELIDQDGSILMGDSTGEVFFGFGGKAGYLVVKRSDQAIEVFPMPFLFEVF